MEFHSRKGAELPYPSILGTKKRMGVWRYALMLGQVFFVEAALRAASTKKTSS